MIILETKFSNPFDPAEEVVLAKVPDNVLPYVTWKRATEHPKEMYWGHYFYTLDEALADFHKRN